MGATDSLVILPLESSSSLDCAGIELVTITWSSSDLAILSKALPVNSPWVAKQLTFKAPICFSTLVASLSVPAVSMMSSIMIACLP